MNKEQIDTNDIYLKTEFAPYYIKEGNIKDLNIGDDNLVNLYLNYIGEDSIGLSDKAKIEKLSKLTNEEFKILAEKARKHWFDILPQEMNRQFKEEKLKKNISQKIYKEVIKVNENLNDIKISIDKNTYTLNQVVSNINDLQYRCNDVNTTVKLLNANLTLQFERFSEKLLSLNNSQQQKLVNEMKPELTSIFKMLSENSKDPNASRIFHNAYNNLNAAGTADDMMNILFQTASSTTPMIGYSFLNANKVAHVKMTDHLGNNHIPAENISGQYPSHDSFANVDSGIDAYSGIDLCNSASNLIGTDGNLINMAGFGTAGIVAAKAHAATGLASAGAGAAGLTISSLFTPLAIVAGTLLAVQTANYSYKRMKSTSSTYQSTQAYGGPRSNF